MPSEQQRRDRVRQGSRRKRDLAVVAPPFDYTAFAAEHFPDERPELARIATWHVHAFHQKRKDPTPAEVRERLEELGWTRAQIGAAA